ncbi:hypothetical protein AXG93_2100s1000 [Marchantia polymorpha subsp. ruderalis]|uniref:Reverse transcriptase/retrotransposon-derived protein RNase H-like domain-containing protein n=1 Tax=Marchantia polymorpha subsp. ruderalis TaxID=1480154 RepID=A0A176VPK8_MARPO|nr:hypothetical protein AXG93_2100s1000 [Marchantia polymorpha subsp. ruderalis]
MCGRVETRSSKRSKDDERDTRRHSRKSKGRKSRGEEKASSKADARSAATSLAMRDTPSARPEKRTDEAVVQVLRRKYVPDIKDEVTEILKEAFRNRTPTEGRKTSGPSTTPSLATTEQHRTVAARQRPHYNVVEDIGNQQANLTLHQLLEDNKTSRKMLMLLLRHPRKPRAVKLPEVYHVTSEDLGPPEIDVEIGGCFIHKVPVDSGSGVNIMTEDTARCLGFRTFEPTTRVLRLADQTRIMPLGMLRNIMTTIGGAEFQLTYIILQPLMKRGYEILLGRPWLYDAQVRGIAVDTEKAKVILKLQPPTNLRELRAFLGHVGYYRRFINMYAILAADLTKLLKKEEPYVWGKEQQLAFETLKAKLTTAPVLRSPDWNRPFHVYVDTSAFAIGVVLSQKDDNKKDYPIYFASHQLSVAERKYTTTEREALGMVYSCKKFRHYLICYEFVFHVDHYALQHLVKKADLSGRIARWVLLLQEFTYTVQTRKGVHHENADYLSRLWTQPTEQESNLVSQSTTLPTSNLLINATA